MESNSMILPKREKGNAFNALSIEAIRHGFYLKDPDDHVVDLYYRGKKLATYSQSGITIEALQYDICEEFKRNLS